MAETTIRCYLVLISILTPNREHAKIPAHLSKLCTESPTVIWSDKNHIGMACQSQHAAIDLYVHIGPLLQGATGLLVVELGRDWCHHGESKAANWLSHRLGYPLPRTIDTSPRRRG